MAEETNRISYIVGADVTNFKGAMSQVEQIANDSADRVLGAFKNVGSFLTKTIGFIGFVGAIEGAVDSASKLASAQNVQATILSDQVKNAKVLQSLDIQRDAITHENYSATLASMATMYSLQTGINRQQITSAQTLLLTNQDMAKMFTTGAKVQSGAFKGMNANLLLATQTAGDLSAVMSQGGGGGSGSMAGAAKALNRLLTDPAKHLSAMTRFGVTLSDAEQNQIKSVEKTNGLYAARELTMKDIEKHIGGAAQAAMSPVERLQNDFQILYQDFGKLFLPILDTLATTLGTLVQALEPVLEQLSISMQSMGSSIGQTLGEIFTMFKPFFTLLTQDLLPALQLVIEPLTKMVSSVLTPLSELFGKFVDTTGPLGKLFTTLGNVLNASLTKAATELAESFSQMVQNGSIQNIFDSLSQSLTILAPVLPELVTAFAQLVVALTPLAVQVLQGMASAFVVFATGLRLVAGIVAPVVKGLADVVKNSGELGKVLAIVAGVWFTRNLFLTPIMAAGGAIGGLITKMGELSRVASSTGGVVKDAFNHRGIGESIMGRSKGYASARTLEEERELERLRNKNNPKDEARIKELESKIENPKSLYQGLESFRKSYKEEGGGLKGLIAGLKNFSKTANLGQVSDHATDQLSATNNLVEALNNLTAKISGMSTGGNGNPLTDAKNDFNKAKGLYQDAKQLSKLGKLAGEGEEVAGVAAEGGEIAAGAGETAGVLSGGLALGPETLGVSVAVAAAAAAYIKWHKTINHAIGVAAHHLENGAKDALKFGDKLAHGAAHAVSDVAKGAEHLAGGILHGIGGFFGGLFGGHSGGGSKGTEGMNGKFTYTDGALNVNIAGHTLSTQKAQNLIAGISAPRAGISSWTALNAQAALRNGTRSVTPENEGAGNVNVTVAPGAFVLNVQGNIDSASMADVKNHVAEQFNNLQYQLKVIGR